MIDLSIGNPSIFEKEYDLRQGSCMLWNTSLNVDAHLPYNKQGCINDLSSAVHNLHSKYHAASALDPNLTGARIVVGHGATQLIMGLLQYISVSGKSISIPKPYWFRMPKMAAMRNAKIEEGYTKLITLPNNPDGTILSGAGSSYLDAVYHWPWYYQDDDSFEQATSAIQGIPPISIFSLGKLSGHCGTRLGWALVSDNALYSFLRDYVEYDAGGVSVEAQLRGAQVINWMLASECSFPEFREELIKRKAEMNTYMAEPLGFKSNWQRPGMFGWLTHDNLSLIHI